MRMLKIMIGDAQRTLYDYYFSDQVCTWIHSYVQTYVWCGNETLSLSHVSFLDPALAWT
jgi:hypothetical protein